MANRDLKETNRRSPSLQALSDAAERIWYRLITSVDDFGRMEADPEVIFTTCFQRVPKGWTIAKVRTCLQELATAHNGEQALIQVYQIGARRYLQISSAERTIYRRAKESKYPAPQTMTMPEATHSDESEDDQTAKNDHEEIQGVTEKCAHMPADADRCAQAPADSLVSRVPSPESRVPNPEPRTSVGKATQAQGTLESFELTPELEAWSAKEGITNPQEYIEEFKDHWRSTGGKRKSGLPVKDWPAAFRNRLRYLKANGLLNPATVQPDRPKQKCAWVNGGGCEEYAAVAGSRYCQTHKDVLEKLQASRRAGHVDDGQPSRPIDLDFSKLGKAMA